MSFSGTSAPETGFFEKTWFLSPNLPAARRGPRGREARNWDELRGHHFSEYLGEAA